MLTVMPSGGRSSVRQLSASGRPAATAGPPRAGEIVGNGQAGERARAHVTLQQVRGVGPDLLDVPTDPIASVEAEPVERAHQVPHERDALVGRLSGVGVRLGTGPRHPVVRRTVGAGSALRGNLIDLVVTRALGLEALELG